MADIIPPDRAQPFLDGMSKMSLRVQTWTELVSRLSILEGVGSPEGVIEAQVAREYMDTTGTTGNIKYIKRNADIAGDRTKGWILV